MAAAAAFFLLPSAAWGQTGAPIKQCQPYDDMTKVLLNNFREESHAFGLGKIPDVGIAMVEFYLSEGGQTWTIIATNIKGRSCIMATGENWRQRAPEPNT